MDVLAKTYTFPILNKSERQSPLRTLSFAIFIIGITLFILKIPYFLDTIFHRTPIDTLTIAQSVMLFGAVLLIAYLLGRFLAQFKLPKITGYLLVGIILGPDIAGFFSRQNITHLQLIDEIALSLIALTAGGEFVISRVREQLKLLLQVTIWQILIVIGGMVIVTLFLARYIDFLQGQTTNIILGVGLLLGVLAVAKSPATTIAIITETRSRGPFTNFILGITIFKDLIIVLLFAFILAFAEPLITASTEIHFNFVLMILQEILLSLSAGIFVGALLYLYIKFIGENTFLFLFGLILLMIEIAHMLHLELILIFMMAGFFVQNLTRFGHDLIETIEMSSLPVYVVFFALAGASLQFNVLMDNWFLTLIFVGARLLTTHLGTFIGARLSGGFPLIEKYGWMGFVGQAGLTLGLVSIIEKDIPAPFGVSIKTIIVAAIAINQILGPMLFRFALGRSREIPDAPVLNYSPLRIKKPGITQ